MEIKMEIGKELDLDSFIKQKLSSNKKGKGFNLPLYKNEILKILDSGLSIADAYEYLTKKYSNLSNMGAPNLYRYIKKIKKAEAGQAEPEKPISPVGQIKAVIPETIQPNAENPPVNLQEKFKEHLANVRSENSAEPIEKKIEQNTEAQIQPQRKSKSLLNQKDESMNWNEYRKSRGMPNPIDDEWRTKPEEE